MAPLPARVLGEAARTDTFPVSADVIGASACRGGQGCTTDVGWASPGSGYEAGAPQRAGIAAQPNGRLLP